MIVPISFYLSKVSVEMLGRIMHVPELFQFVQLLTMEPQMNIRPMKFVTVSVNNMSIMLVEILIQNSQTKSSFQMK